jgi:hypothetical protein
MARKWTPYQKANAMIEVLAAIRSGDLGAVEVHKVKAQEELCLDLIKEAFPDVTPDGALSILGAALQPDSITLSGLVNDWRAEQPLKVMLVASKVNPTMAMSVERFNVTGPGVRNRHHLHVIRGYVGKCCDESRVHLHLSAESIVIAEKQGPAPIVRTVALGDVITVDYTDYRVCGVDLGDPILIPVAFHKI